MSVPLVLQTEDLSDHASAWLGSRCRLVRADPSNRPAFEHSLADAHGLVVRTYTRVDPALLAGAPNLRVVGRAGVGLDNIDVAACRGRGVEVVYTPDANGSAVTELVLAVILDAYRPRLFLDHAPTPARWSQIRKDLTAPRQLEGSTLGVLGLGKVGSRVARAGRALGMNVIYHDVREIPGPGHGVATPVSHDRLLAESDVLTVHVDGRSSNHGLIGAGELARLKHGVVLVNTSRGFVIDTPALARFLRDHPSASAVLDVHDPEPFDASYPLLGIPNAHLMPHIGAATARSHENMSWVVRDVWRVLSGLAPEFPAP
ncbi:MAG: 3-phosphoglycerate dehydrogenase [Phycisphaeraceae bacterium]|nr:MAG: 3-phosphoglycerate dehydrogenase [Phycisphaeraceae bacterium]